MNKRQLKIQASQKEAFEGLYTFKKFRVIKEGQVNCSSTSNKYINIFLNIFWLKLFCFKCFRKFMNGEKSK